MTNKKNIRILKQDVLQDMRINFSNYSYLYKKNNSRKRLEFFEKNSVDTGLVFDMPILDRDEDDSSVYTTNAEKIYKSLNFISLSLAADMRMWGYLCGTVFYNYIYDKLGSEKVESGKFNKKKTADANLAPTAFLCNKDSNNYRALIINYVSRLWWAAHMCEDSGNFKLLNVFNPLPGNLPLTLKFFNNKEIAQTVLRAIYKYCQTKNDGKSSRHIVEEGIKQANIISSSKDLDILPKLYLEDEIYKKMKENIK